MPRVRMLTHAVGPDHNWAMGEEIDMSAQDAAKWADGVRGELVRDEPVATPERRRARPEHTARGGTAERT